MPRGSRGGRGGYEGNFGFYATDGAVFPSDEEAVATACDEMFSMCGNAGQETLIGDYLQDFEDWALEALEAESAATDYGSFSDLVISWYEGRQDKWFGTSQIWSAGFKSVANQSGFHDSTDEYGEGEGAQF